MKTIKHTVIIEKINNTFNAYVNEIDGTVSTGNTLEEIKENVRKALEIYYKDKIENVNLKINYNLSI